jgi:hypothetical protein
MWLNFKKTPRRRQVARLLARNVQRKLYLMLQYHCQIENSSVFRLPFFTSNLYLFPSTWSRKSSRSLSIIVMKIYWFLKFNKNAIWHLSQPRFQGYFNDTCEFLGLLMLAESWEMLEIVVTSLPSFLFTRDRESIEVIWVAKRFARQRTLFCFRGIE